MFKPNTTALSRGHVKARIKNAYWIFCSPSTMSLQSIFLKYLKLQSHKQISKDMFAFRECQCFTFFKSSLNFTLAFTKKIVYNKIFVLFHLRILCTFYFNSRTKNVFYILYELVYHLISICFQLFFFIFSKSSWQGFFYVVNHIGRPLRNKQLLVNDLGLKASQQIGVRKIW